MNELATTNDAGNGTIKNLIESSRFKNAVASALRATLDRGQTDLYTSALREREEIVKRYRALRK